MGRKPKELTEEQTVQVEALAAYLTQDQIADYFGITRPTFAAMIDRDADISLRYKRGKAKAIGAVAQNLIKKAREGDNACMMFYLKTQAGWRETQQLDHTSSDGTMTPKDEGSAIDRINSRLDSLFAARPKGEDIPGDER